MTLIILGIAVLAVIIATIVAVPRDGYRAIPVAPEHSTRAPSPHSTLVSKLG